MSLLAIDPATTKGCACAVFEARALRYIRKIQPGEFDARMGCDRVVFECPRKSWGASSVEDLVRVAVAGARVAELHCSKPNQVFQVWADEWKGATPKPIHHRRMWAKLRPDEQRMLGGDRTLRAITMACEIGAKARWAKAGGAYYQRREMATVLGLKIDDDILDAVALGLTTLKRMR